MSFELRENWYEAEIQKKTRDRFRTRRLPKTASIDARSMLESPDILVACHLTVDARLFRISVFSQSPDAQRAEIVFGAREKWVLIGSISFGVFSPLTSCQPGLKYHHQVKLSSINQSKGLLHRGSAVRSKFTGV